jgi:DNA-3-methyladenine glycosylase
VPDRQLCAGPGNLTQALAITGELDGKSLFAPPFRLLARSSHVEVVSGPRIGITRGIELPWRFGLQRSPFLSRRF